MRNENIELQLEILRIQVIQQHISSFYSMALSAEISIMLSIMVFYAGLYFYFNNPLFGWLAALSIIFIPLIAVTWSAYMRKMNNFEEELKRVRQRFLW
jgi:cbb3-type cytochrome oxidase subunit 3